MCEPMTEDEKKFRRESYLVEQLLLRLVLGHDLFVNPKSDGKERGIDVQVPLHDGRTVGVQVTELDPYAKKGSARKKEKKRHAAGELGGYAQNNQTVVLNSIKEAIERKIAKANDHSFCGLSEVWLLVCTGVPWPGEVVSTFVRTSPLHETDLEAATGSVLQTSKYGSCFLLPINGEEGALYQRERQSVWRKSVILEDVNDHVRSGYLDSLLSARASGNLEEEDRLCDNEAQYVLRELRTRQTN